MRIVQLITQDSGGPVDHALDVAREFARRGHESHLVGPVARFADALDGTGVLAHDVSVAGKRDLAGARALVRLLRELRPDVLHCQDRRAGLVGRVTGRIQRVPGLVYTLHGVADGLSDLVAGNVRAAPRRRRDALYYLSGERWVSRASGARVVVPSAAVARYAIEHVRLPASIVDVVPNGVDVERFTPAPRTASRTATPMTAVWAGLMGPVKRLDVLVDALVDVPRLALRLVGGGPERAAIERAVTARQLSDRVRFEGTVADPAPMFAAADLFVLTSAAENCPLSLLQAMAAGLPVVATRVGGIPEVVRDGVDGLLVPPADPLALAKALRALVADRAMTEAMGASARERVCERYTLARCADGLLATYGRAMSCAS